MLQESWFSRWTFYRYSRSISQRSSLSWITTRNRMDRTKVQRVGRTCKRRPYTSSHSRGKEKILRRMVSHFEQSRQKWACETSIRFRAAVSMKNRLHHESGEQVEEPIHPEQYSRWHPSSSTSWWDKSEWNLKWAHKIFLIDLLFVTVGFAYSRWRSTVTDQGCRQIHLTRNFSHTPCTCVYTTSWLKVS